MSDKGSGGGLLDELPIDRLRSEVTQLGKAVAKNGFTSLIENLGDGTGGAAGKAVESVKKGDSPVKAATKAGTSALKDKVKDAVGGGGGGKKMKVVNILETVDVPVPRRVAYDKWTQFQDIPDFTRKVEKVEQKDDEKVEWKAQIFLSHRTWQATIKEQVPDERIVWESSGEKGHVDGAVTFHELAPDLTRVLMTLEYHPQGFFEKTANLWRAQGRRARADMRQFRREMTMHTMLEQEEQDGWRGEIRDNEVVKSHEEGADDDQSESKEESSGERRSSGSRSRRSSAKKSSSSRRRSEGNRSSSSPAKKSSASKSPGKKSASKRTAKKSSSGTSAARKSTAKKSSSSSSTAKKSAAKKSPAKKSTAKKSSAKKTASKRPAKKSTRSSRSSS